MKVFVLYSHMAPYMAACMRRAAEHHGVEFGGIAFRAHADAPFGSGIVHGLGPWIERESVSRSGIWREVRRFEPDLLLVSGWMDADYLVAARSFRASRGCVVGFCDTPWTGSARQRIAVLGSRLLQRRWFDVMWVPGERQATYARRLGFAEDRIWQGMYSADVESFHGHRLEPQAREPVFLYAGRLVAAKAVATLADAYARYRERVPDPWSLTCIGAGPLSAELGGQPGITVVGFVPPHELPAAMARASAFVLPSRYEPWGVVLQEAAALGHPLIATAACGASVHLVRDGYNGYIVPAGDSAALASALVRMHEASVDDRARMGEASVQLSRQYSPELWARTLVRGFAAWKSSN